MKKIIDYWLQKNYFVHFFCMSNSNKQREDDLYLIKKIINLYPKDKQYMFRLCESNKDIFTQIKKMKYNICWRFHSIILSILTACLPVRKGLQYNRQLVESAIKNHEMSETYAKRLFSGL